MSLVWCVRASSGEAGLQNPVRNGIFQIVFVCVYVFVCVHMHAYFCNIRWVSRCFKEMPYTQHVIEEVQVNWMGLPSTCC